MSDTTIYSTEIKSQYYTIKFNVEQSTDYEYSLGITVYDSIGSIVFLSTVPGRYAYRLYDILCYIEQIDGAYYRQENGSSQLSIAVFPKPLLFQNKCVQICIIKDMDTEETYFSIGMQEIMTGFFNVVKIPYDTSTDQYSDLISLLYANFILRIFAYGTKPSYYFDHIEEFIEKEH